MWEKVGLYLSKQQQQQQTLHAKLKERQINSFLRLLSLTTSHKVATLKYKPRKGPE